MLVVVEGRKPYCWACGVVGHMSKVCTAKNSQPSTQPAAAASTTTVTAKVAATEEAPEGEWKKVKGRKAVDVPTSPGRDELSPRKQPQHKERPKEAQEKHLKGRKTSPQNSSNNNELQEPQRQQQQQKQVQKEHEKQQQQKQVQQVENERQQQKKKKQVQKEQESQQQSEMGWT